MEKWMAQADLSKEASMFEKNNWPAWTLFLKWHTTLRKRKSLLQEQISTIALIKSLLYLMDNYNCCEIVKLTTSYMK